MGKILKKNIDRTFLKIVLSIFLVILILVLIDQISVYQTLKGDGKVHHAVIKSTK